MGDSNQNVDECGGQRLPTQFQRLHRALRRVLQLDAAITVHVTQNSPACGKHPLCLCTGTHARRGGGLHLAIGQYEVLAGGDVDGIGAGVGVPQLVVVEAGHKLTLQARSK